MEATFLSILFGVFILLIVLAVLAFPVVGVLVSRKSVLYPVYGKEWWMWWKHPEEYRTYPCVDANGRNVKLHIRDRIELPDMGWVIVKHIRKDGTIEVEKVKK